MSKSPITIDGRQSGKLAPIHPGEILRAEFLEPLNLSATKLANLMGVPATRVVAIVSDKDRRAITADTALRLSCVFNTSAEFWLNLQSNYEVAMLEFTGERDRIQKQVRQLQSA